MLSARRRSACLPARAVRSSERPTADTTVARLSFRVARSTRNACTRDSTGVEVEMLVQEAGAQVENSPEARAIREVGLDRGHDRTGEEAGFRALAVVYSGSEHPPGTRRVCTEQRTANTDATVREGGERISHAFSAVVAFVEHHAPRCRRRVSRKLARRRRASWSSRTRPTLRVLPSKDTTPGGTESLGSASTATCDGAMPRRHSSYTTASSASPASSITNSSSCASVNARALSMPAWCAAASTRSISACGATSRAERNSSALCVGEEPSPRSSRATATVWRFAGTKRASMPSAASRVTTSSHARSIMAERCVLLLSTTSNVPPRRAAVASSRHRAASPP